MSKLPQLLTDAKREGWSQWIKSEADEAALLEGCWFDVAEGNRWCRFFESVLVHTRSPWRGQPFKLLDWQRDDIVMPLFGWKLCRERPDLRRFNKGDIWVAKKNGKTTITSGIVLGTLAMGAERTEVYGAAFTRDQAGLIYQEAAAMVRASSLSKHMNCIDTHKRIVMPAKQSFYRALAGESGSAEGVIPSLVVFDEIHVQRDRKLYDSLAYAMSATENGLFLSISTVGVADETTIWWEQYEYTKGILNGTIQDHRRFAYLAQADEGCKDSKEMRADREQWRKANPSIGETVTWESMEDAVREAEQSPAKLNNLLRYRFNIPTAQVTRVFDMDKWKACEAKDVPDLAGRRCYAALDMASFEDLACLACYFPPEEGEKRGWLKSWFWCPEERIRQRELKQKAFYRVWVNGGHIRETPGARIDHATILADFHEITEPYNVVEVPYDPWNADAIVNALELEGYQTVLMQQTFGGMSHACNALLGAINDGKLWHDGNPVMTWCCSNVSAQTKADDLIRFDKETSSEKIDGAVAAAMAVGRGTLDVETTSYYDDHDLEMA